MKIKFLNSNINIYTKAVSTAIIVGGLLVGCSPESISADGFYFDTYSVDDKIAVEVGTEENYEIKNPIEGCEIHLSSVPEDIKAEISDDALIFSSDEIGEKKIGITLEAQGYKDTEIVLTF
ncbi:MAG: hypothetical protein RR048_03600, partial [Oscillospiraceae bacterium]